MPRFNLPRSTKLPLAFCALTHLSLFGQPTDFQSRPAIFEVTTDIVNEDVQPFTFTGPAFGNTLKRAGKGSLSQQRFAINSALKKIHRIVSTALKVMASLITTAINLVI